MFSKQAQILKCLDDLLGKIDSGEFRPHDDGRPSLDLWCFYNEYTNEMMRVYSSSDEPKGFVRLLDACEMGDFDVDARAAREVSRKKIVEYVLRIKTKIVGR